MRKVALVTGAGRGLGRSISLELSRAGLAVALLARSAGEIEDVKGEIEAVGGEAATFCRSVASSTDVSSVITEIERKWGRLDVLVNNAGVSPFMKDAQSVDDGEWGNVLDINLTGVFYCCRAAAPLMAKGDGGSIVNMTSIHGSVGLPGLSAYAASKGGVEMLTKTLALEWAHLGIRVNSVAPGYVETGMTKSLRDNASKSATLVGRIPLGRFAVPDEVAPAVVFLASHEARYITGTTIVVDGGWTAQ